MISPVARELLVGTPREGERTTLSHLPPPLVLKLTNHVIRLLAVAVHGHAQARPLMTNYTRARNHAELKGEALPSLSGLWSQLESVCLGHAYLRLRQVNQTELFSFRCKAGERVSQSIARFIAILNKAARLSRHTSAPLGFFQAVHLYRQSLPNSTQQWQALHIHMDKYEVGLYEAGTEVSMDDYSRELQRYAISLGVENPHSAGASSSRSNEAVNGSRSELLYPVEQGTRQQGRRRRPDQNQSRRPQGSNNNRQPGNNRQGNRSGSRPPRNEDTPECDICHTKGHKSWQCPQRPSQNGVLRQNKQAEGSAVTFAENLTKTDLIPGLGGMHVDARNSSSNFTTSLSKLFGERSQSMLQGKLARSNYIPVTLMES
eukprot:15362453-Ditylum_brightwellii.AAC.1